MSERRRWRLGQSNGWTKDHPDAGIYAINPASTDDYLGSCRNPDDALRRIAFHNAAVDAHDSVRALATGLSKTRGTAVRTAQAVIAAFSTAAVNEVVYKTQETDERLEDR